MKSYVTAGIAIVGASAIAVTPVAATPPEQAVRAVDVQSINLLAQPTPSQLLAGLLQGNAVGSLDTEDAVAAFEQLSDGFSQAGLNFVTANLLLGPGLLAIAQAAAAGDRQAVYDGVEAIIDGPLFVAKPLFEAFEAVSPPPIGGEQDADPGLVWQAFVQSLEIRNLFRALAAQIINPPADEMLGLALATQPNVFGDPAASIEVLTDKFTEAASKFINANLLLGPGLLAIGAALAQGNNADASEGLQAIIDGPLYVAKPLFEAFEAVSPPPIGGEQDADPGLVWQAFVQSLGIRDALDDLADNIINPPTSEMLSLALATQPNVFGDPAASLEVLANKFTEAGSKFVNSNLLLGPGLLAIATAAAQGNNAAVSAGVQAIIDGPLYVAKPLFEAFEAVSPPPIGGEQDADPGLVWNAFVQSLGIRDALDDAADNIINPPSSPAVVATFDSTESRQGTSRLIETPSGGGAESVTTVNDPDTTSKRRQLVNLNVLKGNPLLGGGSRAQQGSNAADSGSRTPTHRPGIGKTPVRDLVKRVTSGFDRDDADDSGKNQDSSGRRGN